MRRRQKTKTVAIIALTISVLGLTLGFAAFSNVLTISSSATVTPNESDFKLQLYGMPRTYYDDEFTEEDAEDFYDMFGDNDFAYFADKIGASKLQEIIYDAIRNNDSEDDFISRLELYIEINDLDITSFVTLTGYAKNPYSIMKKMDGIIRMEIAIITAGIVVTKAKLTMRRF